uniref:Uncharacterized protein n=1 Tax=viral metagenome TaxID=1070528 RepID=A0A6M3LTV8_9ZZZZ
MPNLLFADDKLVTGLKISQELDKVERIICPVCGYYCLGKGGFGCIDKKGMFELIKKKGNKGNLKRRNENERL